MIVFAGRDRSKKRIDVARNRGLQYLCDVLGEMHTAEKELALALPLIAQAAKSKGLENASAGSSQRNTWPRSSQRGPDL